jgi:hypothetical protein
MSLASHYLASKLQSIITLQCSFNVSVSFLAKSLDQCSNIKLNKCTSSTSTPSGNFSCKKQIQKKKIDWTNVLVPKCEDKEEDRRYSQCKIQKEPKKKGHEGEGSPLMLIPHGPN